MSSCEMCVVGKRASMREALREECVWLVWSCAAKLNDRIARKMTFKLCEVAKVSAWLCSVESVF